MLLACTVIHLAFFFSLRLCSGHFSPILSVGSHCNPPFPYHFSYPPISMSTFCSPHASTLKLEAAQSSETLVSNHHTIQCNNPENHKFYLHCCGNLKSQNSCNTQPFTWQATTVNMNPKYIVKITAWPQMSLAVTCQTKLTYKLGHVIESSLTKCM